MNQTELLAEAQAFQERGALAEAAARYEQLLAAEPDHAEALLRLGRAYCQQGRLEEGIRSFRRLLARDPAHAPAHNLVGMALDRLGRSQEALASFDRAIACDARFADAIANRADALAALGRFAEAVEGYDRALGLAPGLAEAWCNRGAALEAIKAHDSALASFDRALDLDPGLTPAHAGRAKVLAALGRYDEALAALGRILQRAESAELRSDRALILRDMGRPEEALREVERAIALDETRSIFHSNHAMILRELRRPEEALASCERAIVLNPELPEAKAIRDDVLLDLGRSEEALGARRRAVESDPADPNVRTDLGVLLRRLNRHEEALAEFERAIAMDPDHAGARLGLGVTLLALRRTDKAVESFERVLALAPRDAAAHYNLGNALMQQKRPDEATGHFRAALEIEPRHKFAFGHLVDATFSVCDWSRFDELRAAVETAVDHGPGLIRPLTLMQHSADPALLLRCARRYVRELVQFPAPSIVARSQSDRIRVAYLSADFRRHPGAYLIAELLELHDRRRFEIVGVSFGPNDGSDMRARIVKSFDRFLEVNSWSDQRSATALRELGVDIAVDRSGHTRHARTGILARRAAPVQVGFLAFPGTTGADFIDYIIGDPIVTPFEDQEYFSERIVQLPDSYQANDRKRRIAERTPTRAEAGLPARGFVFCCFNRSEKLQPLIFDRWMQLLGQVDGSVLWLLGGRPALEANLRREAAVRGVDPGRVVFAGRAEPEDHLARHRLADLMLDTLPYNAHTTASDALWTGLPLVTCKGRTFAARVAASLLHAIGLPELVTESLDEYEALALRLAREPDHLALIRKRLADNRLTTPLFDTDRYRQHLEAAYMAMWERNARGEPPASFAVPHVPD